MTEAQRLKSLEVPNHPVDVVLDTDAFNEVDDQFAIAYLLRNKEKLRTKAIYAAPFHNGNSTGPANGMERSYNEILKVLDIMGEKAEVFKGADRFLPEDNTPVISDASLDLVKRAKNYSPDEPLYVIAIAAITNVASALLMDPSIAENIVIVWLGGQAHHVCPSTEFNLVQDVASAKIVMGSGAPFVQLPCGGVVSAFTTTAPELQYWLYDKTPIADYLARNTVRHAESYAKGRVWCRSIWDVTAVAWLLNDGDRFMSSRIIDTPIPTRDNYIPKDGSVPMRYVTQIKRDALFGDLFEKLCEK